jgi:hypothetical protein
VLPLKDLRGRGVGKRVMVWVGAILREFEGPPGGRSWEAGTPLRQACGAQAGEIGAAAPHDYNISVQLVKDYL